MHMRERQIIAGNAFDKYRSRNPLHRKLVGTFLARARELLILAAPQRILEVGAGEGDLAFALFASGLGNPLNGVQYLGTDVSTEQVRIARVRHASFSFQCANVYQLPFEADSFDLCLACEVFEHLDDPAAALSEVARVTRRYLLASVPWEPVWRLLNVLRGCYIRHGGNTPGHVQHFTRKRIRRLVSTRFEVVAERRPLPWTMLLAEHRMYSSRSA